jgi:ureidoacrylate peracid hydrolase
MIAANKRITIDARPEALTIEPARTAVIVVDMQNDFGSDGGMMALAGIDISGNRAVIPQTARVLAAARQAGILVVYLKMAFRADLSDAGAPDAPNWLKHLPLHAGEDTTTPHGTASRILVRDTWNTDIVAELQPEPADVVLYKHRYSGFYETDLDKVLESRSINSLIFTGWTTSVCVESTVRDAMFRDYSCLVLEDCTAEPIGKGLPRSNHEASLLAIQILFGWVSESATFVAALEQNLADVRV